MKALRLAFGILGDLKGWGSTVEMVSFLPKSSYAWSVLGCEGDSSNYNNGDIYPWSDLLSLRSGLQLSSAVDNQFFLLIPGASTVLVFKDSEHRDEPREKELPPEINMR